MISLSWVKTKILMSEMMIVMRVLVDLGRKKQETLQIVNIRGKVHIASSFLYIDVSQLSCSVQ